MTAQRPSTARGFSLLELLAVIAIVSLLALVAIPSYRESVQKSRRADAKVALNELALRLERCYTQFGRYDHDDCEIDAPFDSPEGYYSVSLVRAANTYTLTATAQGAQSNDGRCTELSVDHLGQHEASGSSPEQCW